MQAKITFLLRRNFPRADACWATRGLGEMLARRSHRDPDDGRTRGGAGERRDRTEPRSIPVAPAKCVDAGRVSLDSEAGPRPDEAEDVHGDVVDAVAGRVP